MQEKRVGCQLLATIKALSDNCGPVQTFHWRQSKICVQAAGVARIVMAEDVCFMGTNAEIW